MIKQKNNEIGAKLKYYRKQKAIKQSTIAEKLKVSLSYISKIENGKMPIYLMLFLKYCNVLDIPPSELIDSLKDLLL